MSKQIVKNVTNTKHAKEVFALMSDYIRELELKPVDAGKVWRKVGDMVDEVTQVRAKLQTLAAKEFQPMEDKKARKYEKKVIEFGKHKGKTIGEAPESYLSWLHEQYEDDWKKDLGRYLRSRYVRQQTLFEDDEDEG